MIKLKSGNSSPITDWSTRSRNLILVKPARVAGLWNGTWKGVWLSFYQGNETTWYSQKNRQGPWFALLDIVAGSQGSCLTESKTESLRHKGVK